MSHLNLLGIFEEDFNAMFINNLAMITILQFNSILFKKWTRGQCDLAYRIRYVRISL